MNFDIRFEQPGRADFTIATPRAEKRTEHTSSLVVMVLTLACTAMAILDLALLALASGH